MQKIKISDLKGSIAPLLSCFVLQSKIETHGMTKTLSIKSSKLEKDSFEVTIETCVIGSSVSDLSYFQSLIPLNELQYVITRCGFDADTALDLVPKNMGAYSSKVQAIIKHVSCHLMFAQSTGGYLALSGLSVELVHSLSKYLGKEVSKTQDHVNNCGSILLYASTGKMILSIESANH